METYIEVVIKFVWDLQKWRPTNLKSKWTVWYFQNKRVKMLQTNIVYIKESMILRWDFFDFSIPW